MKGRQPANPAQTYQDYFVPAMFEPWAAVLLRHASPEPGERALDVACGTGIVARLVAPLVGAKGHVVGLDVSPAMLAVARGAPVPPGAAIQWQEGNAAALPFPDGAFDVVLCQHGLQFFPDRAGAVREMHRVLARGGRAAVIVLQALARHPVFESVVESTARHLAQPVRSFAAPFALSDAGELRNLFDAAGFRTVRVAGESTTVRFSQPERFVPLAITSSAAAVPAFSAWAAPEHAALLEAVGRDAEATISRYRLGDVIAFPMFAHVAVATR